MLDPHLYLHQLLLRLNLILNAEGPLPKGGGDNISYSHTARFCHFISITLASAASGDERMGWSTQSARHSGELN